MSGLRVLEFIDEKEAENPGEFWTNVYFLVFFVPLVLAAGLYLLLKIFKFPTTLDDDTTRYLLSAFIQSLAAVIAIVVSLTLVAIQFTASEYSSRVIEVFKKNHAMWAIIAGYISGISLFAFILMSISDSEVVYGIKSYAVFYSFFLFIALLVTLIPHIRITLNSMNAEKVIDNLFDDLTSEKLISLQPKDDPFHDLFVIINSSAIKGDMVTFSYGLKRIREKFIEIVNSSEQELNSNSICSGFYDNVKRTSLILFEKREEKFLFEIIINMNNIVRRIDCNNILKFKEDTLNLDESIEINIHNIIAFLGNNAIDHEFESIYSYSINLISGRIAHCLGLYYYKHDDDYIFIMKSKLLSLNKMAYKFMKSGNSQSYDEIVSEIKNINQSFIDNSKEVPNEIINLLVDKWNDLVYRYMKSPECQKGQYYLEPIWELVSYSKISHLNKEEIENILEILKDIGRDAYRKYNLPEITILIKRELFDLGLHFMDEDNSELNDIVVNYLAELHYLCDGLEEIENDSKNRFAYSSGVYVGEKELEYRRGSIYTDIINTLERPYSCSDEEAEYIKKRIYIE
ncbi:DUF2254 domain-containing protein [Methanoplanus endosymbiosus]|uniref:DUF2254 domain-containing protein n=1 Tax=Methanoplanus endosymbiosus TaxID=33865 RepID=A0A9E7TKC1_9EURY|nr:DUF2254 domain-containing protein [Methanoplanus endosymbiosus]UUX92490.1 DUF2254 domain-containing protein [Methanoplanus endosymbiosus]